MRILRIKDVVVKAGICRTRVYLLESEGRFPRRIILGPNSVGWLDHEVDDWIADRVRESRSGVENAMTRRGDA